MKLQTNKNNTRLGGYLTAAVSCSTLASTASAAVVSLDISSIDGINGGIAVGNYQHFYLSSLSPGLSGILELYNGFYGTNGLDGDYGLNLATTANDAKATPRNFSSGSLIDASANFEDFSPFTVFRYDLSTASPDFGANSFIGFRSADGNYGYFEVTWSAATNTFQILSGAYESVAGVGITTPAAIPEPSTAVLSLGALAAGAFIRRRKQAA